MKDYDTEYDTNCDTIITYFAVVTRLLKLDPAHMVPYQQKVHSRLIHKII